MIIKIIIVEDDKELRTMLQQFFNMYSDLSVIKTFANSNSFLNEYLELDCDVVIMDINIPGKNGIECIAEAKPLKPQVEFVVSTALENHDYIFQALCSGATGYLLKSDKP